jgi:hypothetical protein
MEEGRKGASQMVKRVAKRNVLLLLFKDDGTDFLTVWFERFTDEIPTVFRLIKDDKGKEMEVKTELVLCMRTE